MGARAAITTAITVTPTAVTAWVEGFRHVISQQETTPRTLYHGIYQNSKIFLLNLYFVFAHQETPVEGAHDLQAQLFEVLRLFKT